MMPLLYGLTAAALLTYSHRLYHSSFKLMLCALSSYTLSAHRVLPMKPLLIITELQYSLMLYSNLTTSSVKCS